MSEPKSLAELRAQIRQHVSLIGKAPFLHNIIGIVLQQIDTEFGPVEANKVIDDFGLRKLGWDYQTCDYCGHWPCGCGG